MSTEEDKVGEIRVTRRTLDAELAKGRGVNVYWLAAIFDMSLTTVRHKLGTCPILKASGKGSHYDLAVAARYLVEPVDDLETYIKRLKPENLPAALRKEVWAAKLSQQTWEERAGLLWRTEDVMEAFAGVFTTIKSTTQLWADTVERQKGLTPEQRKLLVQLTDSLQDTIYNEMVSYAEDKETPSSRGVIEDGKLAMSGKSVTEMDPEDLI